MGFFFRIRSASKSGPWGLMRLPTDEWHCMQSVCWWHDVQLVMSRRAASPCCNSQSGWPLCAAPDRRFDPVAMPAPSRWHDRQNTSVLWHDVQFVSRAKDSLGCRATKSNG